MKISIRHCERKRSNPAYEGGLPRRPRGLLAMTIKDSYDE